MSHRLHRLVPALLAAAFAAACVDAPSLVSPVAGTGASSSVALPSSGVGTAATVVVGPYTITITDLGVLPGATYSSGYAINNTGLAAGVVTSAAGLQPALFQNGTITPIPNFDASGVTIPVRLNDAGDLILNQNVGGTSINYAIWRDVAGTYHRLPPYPGGDVLRVTARGINSAAHIVGMVRESIVSPVEHGVIWRSGAFFQDIGAMAGYNSTSPEDINDQGAVVGTSINTTNFNRTAFLWQNGAFTDLGINGGAAKATAMNNTGTVVGYINGGFPVRWVNGQRSSLPVPAGVIQPTPVDVNDAGDIIGWGTSSAPGVLYSSAFWRNGSGILLPPWPGATQTLVRTINNLGEIIGEGNLVPGGPMHALVWRLSTGNPPPPPPPNNVAPVVTLSALSATTIRVGGSVQLRGVFTDPDNGPWRYSFRWGNGQTSGTKSKNGNINGTRTYTRAGSYSARLIVTDAKGAADTSNVIAITVR